MKKHATKNTASRFGSTLLPLLIASPICSSALAADLTVNISTVKKTTGEILLAIYDSKDNFRKTEIIANRKTAVKGEMVFSFPDLAVGSYAVMVFHDVNGNGELDTNLLGMPAEPWGASLEGKSVFGAPGWTDTRFELPEAGKSITVKLM